MSKRKGKVGELQAAAEVARLFNVECRRGCQFSGAPGSPDIAADISGVHFEVKRCERLRLYESMQQAVSEAGEDVPVVLHRANGKPWVAVVPLDELPQLVVRLYLTLAETA